MDLGVHAKYADRMEKQLTQHHGIPADAAPDFQIAAEHADHHASHHAQEADNHAAVMDNVAAEYVATILEPALQMRNYATQTDQ